MEWFNELVEYQKLNAGDCNPVTHSKLGRWVANQRILAENTCISLKYIPRNIPIIDPSCRKKCPVEIAAVIQRRMGYGYLSLRNELTS
mmetsp:Transcript_26681/g.64012  ORF Transcript_26681/g.64012 Transcript_26681/m.64012 type:complete len:88 (-) Transcript_26681:539-802(-)